MDAKLHDLICEFKKLADQLGRLPTSRDFLEVTTSRRIQEYGFNNIVKLAGFEPRINNAQKKEIALKEQTRSPKILVFDIETSPITAYTWGLWDQNVGLNQIVRDWFVLSYAAKFLGEDTIHYLDQRYAEKIDDDKQLLEGIHHLISEADYLLGHNAKRFDIKKLNARFIKHDLPPIKDIIVIDTLSIAKKHFAFTSNKLEYIAKYLGCDNEKLKHKEFSGQEMWNETIKGNIKAFEAMEEYNKMDVIVTEQVYHKLVKWDSSINYHTNYSENVCTCGSKTFSKYGYRYTKAGTFRVYRCVSCFKNFTSKENLLDKDIKKGLFK